MLRTCTFEGFLECGLAVVDASVELNIIESRERTSARSLPMR